MQSIESSVLLRVLFGQPNALKDWEQIEQGISSALIQVGCLRTLDHVRLVEGLAEGSVEKSPQRRSRHFSVLT